jgi:hypothetical protein
MNSISFLFFKSQSWGHFKPFPHSLVTDGPLQYDSSPMKSTPLEHFWLEKEKEHKSSFLTATSAEYLGGYQRFKAPIRGLLYVMKNGIYFENFKEHEWWRGVVRDVFHIDDDFTKITMELKNKNIVDVSCFRGQKNKLFLTIGERLSLFLGKQPRRLFIDYREEGRIHELSFNCDQPPIALCAAYYRAREKKPSA